MNADYMNVQYIIQLDKENTIMIIYRGYGIIKDKNNQWRVCSISNRNVYWGNALLSIDNAKQRIDSFYIIRAA